MKECNIFFKDGEKEAALNLEYTKENEHFIMESVFKFFGMEVDYVDVANKRIAVDRLYKAYYGDSEEYKTEKGGTEHVETGESGFEELQKQVSESKNTNVEKPVTEFPKEDPGMRIKGDVTTYRCNYQCPKCKNTGNHYITRAVTKINCHKCGTEMKPYQANKDFTHDENFNYFLAGLRWKKEEVK